MKRKRKKRTPEELAYAEDLTRRLQQRIAAGKAADEARQAGGPGPGS